MRFTMKQRTYSYPGQNQSLGSQYFNGRSTIDKELWEIIGIFMPSLCFFRFRGHIGSFLIDAATQRSFG